MAKVTLSKEAQRDIIAIRNYIRDELCNPSAAKHIIACLKRASSPSKSSPGVVVRWTRCCLFIRNTDTLCAKITASFIWKTMSG